MATTSESSARAAAAPAADCHVHLWGTGDGGSGIWVSRRYRYSLRFLGNGLLLGMHRRGGGGYDGYYLDLLLAALRESSLSHAVVQGMEAVYDARGQLDRRRTAIHIPNEYTYRVCREHPGLVPAAAISPARADWQRELELAAENRAACVKLNPCVGGTDPADRRWLPFYRRMRELGLVLMCHTGPERAVPVHGPRSCSPAALELPLSEGLTVIASHAGTGTPFEGRGRFDAMVGLMERWENFYADTSAVAQAPRWGWLRRIGAHPLVRARLLHGSDYPVPLTLLPWGVLGCGSWLRLRRIRSRLAKDLVVKEAAGYGRESAQRAARVLGIVGKAVSGG
jgi:predicted TIM-barrel fold metal-dependent hydrolase